MVSLELKSFFSFDLLIEYKIMTGDAKDLFYLDFLHSSEYYQLNLEDVLTLHHNQTIKQIY